MLQLKVPENGTYMYFKPYDILQYVTLETSNIYTGLFRFVTEALGFGLRLGIGLVLVRFRVRVRVFLGLGLGLVGLLNNGRYILMWRIRIATDSGFHGHLGQRRGPRNIIRQKHFIQIHKSHF